MLSFVGQSDIRYRRGCSALLWDIRILSGSYDMDIVKSTRHSKITGDFAEGLVLYWLSKYGFECARVDHTGIDLIAKNPHTHELMGISVKSRCRIVGREATCVSIPADNFSKVTAACETFGCEPYFAVVVDAADSIRGFILPMARLHDLCPPRGRGSYWKMSPQFLRKCSESGDVRMFEFRTSTSNWWTPAR
jgi:hypothetical protein